MRARRYNEQKGAELFSVRHEPWHFFCRNTAWRGFQVEPITDPAGLWHEGQRHGNCLFKLRYAATANFAAQNYNNWQSLGAFGNSTMYVDRFDYRYHGGGRGLRSVRRGSARGRTGRRAGGGLAPGGAGRAA